MKKKQKRICKGESCNKEIEHRNKSGFCVKCYGKIKKKCKICKKEISRYNNTGMCIDCGKESRRQFCKICPKEISNKSKTGLCHSCAAKKRIKDTGVIPGLIDGRSTKTHYCIEPDCDRVVHWRTAIHGKGRCKSCAKKGTLNYGYKERIKTFCGNKDCKKEIEVYPRVFEKNKNNFCSIECKNKFHIEYMKLNALKGKDHPNHQGLEKPECLICGKPLSAYHCKYCVSCYHEYCAKGSKRPKQSKIMTGRRGNFHTEETKSKLSLMRGGTGIPYEIAEYPAEFNDILRYNIRTRDNFICQKCDITEEEHLIKFKKVLCVHHIDYDKQNSDKVNLITLCNNCNLEVNRDKDYWTEYFTEKMKCKIN